MFYSRFLTKRFVLNNEISLSASNIDIDLLDNKKSVEIKLFMFSKLVAIETMVELEVFYPNLQGFVTGVNLHISLNGETKSGYTNTTFHSSAGLRQNTVRNTAIKLGSIDSFFIWTNWNKSSFSILSQISILHTVSNI